MFQDNFLRELIVDNFAGGGGASTGMELALGVPVDIAINHNKDAIAMHQVNHPYTQHYQEDVWQVDPLKVTGGRPVGVAWFSPDCTHFSKAKGGTPVEKKIRGLAWVALRWAAKVRPRIIMLENVEEFTTWGPIIPMRHNGRCVKEIVKVKEKGKTKTKYITAQKGEVLPVEKQIFIPDKKRAGQTFQRFVSQLRDLGYAVGWKILKACDYGAPTIRKRFYLIARNDGREIVFPKATHGEKEGLKPFKTAADCIDWTIPCPSIFGRKKDLAVNTQRRIARGLDKFVIKNPKPFILQMNFKNAPQDIESPLSTHTAVNKHFVVQPTIKPYIMSNNTGNIGARADSPLPTVTTGNRNFLITPSIVPVGYGEREGQKPRIHDIEKPLSTVVGSAVKQNLVTPILIQYHSETSKKEVRGQKLNEPIMTVDGSPRYGVNACYLSKYFSGEKQAGADINSPTPAVTAIDHNALVSVNLSCRYGNGEDGRGSAANEPIPTVTGTNHNHLVAANIVHYYSGADHASKADNPLPTVTVEPRHYLTESHLCVLRNNMDCKVINSPIPTLTTSPGHMAEVRTYLQKIDTAQNLGNWAKVRELLNEYAVYGITDDEILILEINGIQYFISDIGMRMLKAEELKLAQGFPKDYVIDIESYIGKKYSESKQIARLGNAVCPPVAAALVRANCPELAVKSIIPTMAILNAEFEKTLRRNIRRRRIS